MNRLRCCTCQFDLFPLKFCAQFTHPVFSALHADIWSGFSNFQIRDIYFTIPQLRKSKLGQQKKENNQTTFSQHTPHVSLSAELHHLLPNQGCLLCLSLSRLLRRLNRYYLILLSKNFSKRLYFPLSQVL